MLIVGWSAGLGSAGVSGYSYATATTDQERFEAKVGLISSALFMFVAPKVLQYANTRVSSANELNAQYMAAKGPNAQPPWAAETMVTETILTRPAVYVRVYTEGQTRPVGVWVMDPKEIAGLSFPQIQQKFALPHTPTAVNQQVVPAGTTIRIGAAGKNAFGPGGGMQVNVVDPLPSTGP